MTSESTTPSPASSTPTDGPQPRIALVGATGKMGRAASQAITEAEDLKLVAELNSRSDLQEILDAGATHVLDLTVPTVSESVVNFAVDHDLHVVVGTSGWSDDKRERLTQRLAEHPAVGVLIAPNFSIGSVLASKFAAQAAPFFDSVEIIEMHHPAKVDAPSGTAARTASMIAEAREQAGVPVSGPDATQHDPDGARGAKVDGINVHAVRLAGLEAHQEVLLGTPGQQLVIRHDAFDRQSYMPGVLLGLRQVAARSGLTYGLDDYLGL